ncbi:hypothetical protein Mal4_58370 [Maioricimonas rarisocia]|uniref:Double zinc ribbon n=1 Tax=Maioricimonas rarisocia TaxID=2528026 RepID=A0A517ZGA1_9PLAN|nr:hypothetical protein Mal4_58370 [Maioricimonas rarisocia]
MVRVEQTTCPSCGTNVPQNCVRCRDCGEFLRAEIAEHYSEIKKRPSRVIHSDVGEATNSSQSR